MLCVVTRYHICYHILHVTYLVRMNWPRNVANWPNWPKPLSTEGVVLPPLIKDSDEHSLCSLIIFHISYLWIYGYLLWNMANFVR